MKNKAKRLRTALLAGTMAISLVCGCNSTTLSDDGKEGAVENTGSYGGDAKDEEGTAMGRYLEEAVEMSGSISGYQNKLFKLQDKTLVIADEDMADFLVSTDGGSTWETEKKDWLTERGQNGDYIMDLTLGGFGVAGIIYDAYDTGEEEEIQDGETYESSIQADVEIILSDGSRMPVTVPVTEDDRYPDALWIGDDGRIFASTLGPNIYEITEDGKCEKFLTVDNIPKNIQFVGNLMIIDGYDYDSLLIYDMEKKEYIEDEVLDKFINENYKNRTFNGGSWYDLYFFAGEDGALYLAGEKGLHRHIIGGSAIEQVIDGRLCCFSNPTYGLLGMVMLPNNEFLALFNQGRLVRFTYHEDVPTVPEETVTVYSLKENYTIRQAVSLYQTANPEVYVKYEIGMEENDSVTREDAIKKLNTEIMAGSGPDLLILDDMPVDSYIEKGLLLDLSPFISTLSGEEELFSNIVNAFKEGDKIYTLPCEIQLPVMEGKEEYVSGVKDMESMAELTERLRKENPGENLLDTCSEKGIMKLFAMVCAPSWKMKEGEIDKEAVSEFLAMSKRIYNAQMDGLPEQVIEKYREVNEWYRQNYNMSMEDTEGFGRGVDDMNYLCGQTKVSLGTLSSSYGYAELTSLQRKESFKDNEIFLMAGQSSQVFCAETLAGISTASEKQDLAEGLLRVLLGKDNVTSVGFSINRAAFEKELLPDERFYISDDEVYSMISISDEEGRYYSLDVYWINEEQKAALREWMETVATPYIADVYLENAVYEAGISYIQGKVSLTEAVKEIEKKATLYMAE